jgi:hypothetical protein
MSITLKYRQRYSTRYSWYSFEKFCKDLMEELGETIYSQLEPKEEGRSLFSIAIPQANKFRIRDSIRAKSWVEPFGNETITYKENIAA